MDDFSVLRTQPWFLPLFPRFLSTNIQLKVSLGHPESACHFAKVHFLSTSQTPKLWSSPSPFYVSWHNKLGLTISSVWSKISTRSKNKKKTYMNFKTLTYPDFVILRIVNYARLSYMSSTEGWLSLQTLDAALPDFMTSFLNAVYFFGVPIFTSNVHLKCIR